MEIWKPIKLICSFDKKNYKIIDTRDFSEKGYLVSNTGKIKNKKGLILKTKKRSGYEEIGLCSNGGKRFFLRIHQIVLQTFEGVEEFKSIDHIDRDKLNNNLNNLRWRSRKKQNDNRKDNYIKYLEDLLIENGIDF